MVTRQPRGVGLSKREEGEQVGKKKDLYRYNGVQVDLSFFFSKATRLTMGGKKRKAGGARLLSSRHSLMIHPAADNLYHGWKAIINTVIRLPERKII